MTVGDKYQLAFNLAKILNTFHAVHPAIIHGHISSHNIFLEFQTISGAKRVSGVRIGDVELAPLIKYSATFYNYKNVSVWSSPEILKQQSQKKSHESIST